MQLWVLQLKQRSVPDLEIRADIWGSFTVGFVCLFLRWEELNSKKGMQVNMRVRVLKSACSLYAFIACRRNMKSFWATFAVLPTHFPSLGFFPLHSDKETAGVTPPEAEKFPVQLWLLPWAAAGDGAQDVSHSWVVLGAFICLKWYSEGMLPHSPCHQCGSSGIPRVLPEKLAVALRGQRGGQLQLQEAFL